MELLHSSYEGYGINHDKEEFRGEVTVRGLTNTKTKTLRYIATRLSDNTKVHEEVGVLTEDENGKLTFHVHMEEMPCVTVHSLKEQSDNRWVFEYEGSGRILGFNSELVFEFDGDSFKYLHRWAMDGDVSDKSWCLLKPV